jgi:hypothetical protein
MMMISGVTSSAFWDLLCFGPLASAPPLRRYRYPQLFPDLPLVSSSVDRGSSASTPPPPATNSGCPVTNIDLVRLLRIRLCFSADVHMTFSSRRRPMHTTKRRRGRASVPRESIRGGKVQLGYSNHGNVRDGGYFFLSETFCAV